MSIWSPGVANPEMSSYEEEMPPSLPSAPGCGSKGNAELLTSNYHSLQCTLELFGYEVEVDPVAPDFGEIEKLMKRTYPGCLMNGCELYTTEKLQTVVLVHTSCVDGDVDDTREKIPMFSAHTVKVSHKWGPERIEKMSPRVSRALVTILQQSLKPTRSYVTRGKLVFSPSMRYDLTEGLQAWPGFYQDVRLTNRGIYLIIDPATCNIFNPCKVSEFVRQFCCLESLGPLSDVHVSQVRTALQGVKVLTNTDPPIESYVSDILTTPTSETRIEDWGGQDLKTAVSLQDYLYITYNVSRDLEYPRTPVVQLGTEKKYYFPLECCNILDGQLYIGQLSRNQLGLRSKTGFKKKHIKEVLNVFYDQSSLDRYGITINKEHAKSHVKARVLPPPQLKCFKDGKEFQFKPKDGIWSFENKMLVDRQKVQHWALLNLSHGHTGDFQRELVQTCTRLGMVVGGGVVYEQNYIELPNIQMLLDDITAEHDLQFLIVIPDPEDDVYDSIKKYSEAQLGIMTAVCAFEDVKKCETTFLVHLAMEINAKVGGRNVVLSGDIPYLTDHPTIVFGAYVNTYVSSRFTGVVASMDWPQMSRYKAKICAHVLGGRSRTTYFADLEESIRTLLNDFISTNGALRRILFYRFAPNEGDEHDLHHYQDEVNVIKKVRDSIKDCSLCKITVVTVQESDHTRFFPIAGKLTPGTVVDGQICKKGSFEFYLYIPCEGLITNCPSRYHVICDENNFEADDIQTLTYSLCHTYTARTNSVSVVPPALYAQRATRLGRMYFSDSPATEVNRKFRKLHSSVRDGMFFC